MGPLLVTRQVSNLLVVHFIGQLSLETKPRPRSWPSLSIIWRLLNWCNHCGCHPVWRRARPRTRCRCRTLRPCLVQPYCGRPSKSPRCRLWRNCSRREHVTPWCRHPYWWLSSIYARREPSSDRSDRYAFYSVHLFAISYGCKRFLCDSCSFCQKIQSRWHLSTCSCYSHCKCCVRLCKYLTFYACIKVILYMYIYVCVYMLLNNFESCELGLVLIKNILID